ncbi:MAG: hypothetical protein BJ554DRAFT_3177 [Olpidium bornovanus]|uniref:Uncharacterized protein n=1 Tax=Olpidium bornovanus TaxID=278681 RepID=A0A8H8DLN2_9FUNG|nr:MAG: hypothetical protein BJ554DRAFT_3177 [Olpidium bornovanus]
MSHPDYGTNSRAESQYEPSAGQNIKQDVPRIIPRNVLDVPGVPGEAHQRVFGRCAEIKHPEDFLVAAGRQQSSARVQIRRADDMAVSKGAKLVARVRIPHLRGEVGGPRRRTRSVAVQASAPNCAFMPSERS